MKRNILIILSLLLLIVSGCGNGALDKTSPTQAAVPQTSKTTAASTERETLVLFTTTSHVSSEATVSAAAAPETSETTLEKLPETSLMPEDYDNAIVKTAESLIGIDFVDGGTSPAEGFDNSGFIYYVLRSNGYINCPRMIDEQVAWGESVDIDNLSPGNIVYFSGEPGGRPEYGGIYAGGGNMIYAPYPGDKVKTVDISGNYWVKHFASAISI